MRLEEKDGIERKRLNLQPLSKKMQQPQLKNCIF